MGKRSEAPPIQDRLREAVIATDAAAGEPDLSPAASARIRAAMREAIPAAPSRRWVAAAVVAAAILVGVVLVGFQFRRETSSRRPDAHANNAVPQSAPAPREKVRIEYTASNDVRIIWTVDPNFHLE